MNVDEIIGLDEFTCNTINENLHNKTDIQLVGEVLKLRQAIRNHRDQKGDDRCWMDDEELYKVLPEGYTPPERDTTVELALCEKYIGCRRNPATQYVSPQRRIEELEEENRKLSQNLHVANLDRYNGGSFGPFG